MESLRDRTGIVDEGCCGAVDPAEYALCVRQFALDAHRILNDPFATAHELVDLSGQIDALWRRCPAPRAPGLDRWLLTARERVRRSI